MQEKWKDVIGYEDEYQVSNLGKVRSKDRTIYDCRGMKRKLKGKVLCQTLTNSGYMQVALCKNGERKNHFVHRVVAHAFLKSKATDTEINHKDENKLNNNVKNLEWCDHVYNMNYGTRIERVSKTVYQYSKQMELIAKHKSAWEIARKLGYDQANICKCCNKKRKAAYGYIWSYVELTK